MEQKFYVASKGDPYLSLTDHPGELTENDILHNLDRMMEMDMDEEEKENMTWTQLRGIVRDFYEENKERILEMVKPWAELKEITEEQAEEIQNLSFEEWQAWEFPRTEWD